jgi:nitroreductase
MNFLELTQARYSSRSYLPTPVDDDTLNYLLEAARRAPSAVNRQPWQFLVVRSEERRRALQSCYDREWFATAPLYVVVCVDDDAAWVRAHDGKSHADIDGAIATEHLCLAAADRGIGSCWVCNFDAARLSALFQLPPQLRPMVIVPLGHIKERPQQASPRKPAADVIRFL